MTWETAQAGNRASKTGRYLQWWESVAEQGVVSSVLPTILERIRIEFKSFNVRVTKDISIDFGMGPRGGGYAALLRVGSAAPGLRPAHGVQSPIP